MTNSEFMTGVNGIRGALEDHPNVLSINRVSVPVMYPSGSTAMIEVTASGDHCFVSDMGLGHMEAELAAAGDIYPSHARQVAERFGVGYNEMALFILRSPIDRLEAAITVVANASAQAASATILSAAEQKEARRNDELFVRVREIFGAQAVAKSVEIKGRTAAWEAHNVVQLPNDRRAIFEFVNDHILSVSSKFFMFSDISKAAQPPARNSVIRGNFSKVGSKGQALADVSNIIRLDSSSDEFRRYAVGA